MDRQVRYFLIIIAENNVWQSLFYLTVVVQVLNNEPFESATNTFYWMDYCNCKLPTISADCTRSFS